MARLSRSASGHNLRSAVHCDGVLMLLAVDPGVRGCGCALWNCNDSTGRLLRAEYVLGSREGLRADAWRVMALAVARWSELYGPARFLAIETPKVYPGPQQKGDQQDLLDLSCVVGAICYAVKDVPARVYQPFEWKGNLPKSIHHERAKKRLDASEMSRIVLPKQKSLAHNVLDAIALGLTHLRRM